MDSGEVPVKSRRLRLLLISSGIFLLFVVLAGLRIYSPAPRSYTFVTLDHPIEMWEEGGDKWSYYMLDETNSMASVTQRARKELILLGFVEDTSQKPWFRFTKGKEEVVICYSHEFAVGRKPDGSLTLKNVKKDPLEDFMNACVLVKNGPGTELSIREFEIRRKIRGW